MNTVADRMQTWSSFVKVEHTLFSLPVLLAGAFLAARGAPPVPTLGWIALAGAGARTLAMALNRIIDRHVDSRNPRTASRELPSGRMTLGEAYGVAAVGLALYLFACAQLPPICLVLSPVPVLAFAVYPWMKRFTPLAHFGVGFALSLAPLGAWVAVTGSLAGSGPAVLLALFTGLWVAGFDVIYATLDEDFDRSHGLQSLPGRLGSPTALRVAALIHTAGVAALVVLYARHLDGSIAALLLLAVAAVLAAEHVLASRVNLAFFHLNILVGFLVFATVVAGIRGL